jgi:hypothetical protein
LNNEEPKVPRTKATEKGRFLAMEVGPEFERSQSDEEIPRAEERGLCQVGFEFFSLECSDGH